MMNAPQQLREISRAIEIQKARQEATKNGYIKTCCQAEIDRQKKAWTALWRESKEEEYEVPHGYKARLELAKAGEETAVISEYKHEIRVQRARQEATDNGFIKTCCEDEIKRISKELAKLQKALG